MPRPATAETTKSPGNPSSCRLTAGAMSEKPRGPTVPHIAVVLDHGNVGRRRRGDACGAQHRDRHRLFEGEQPDARPSLPHRLPRCLVARVRQDDLGLGTTRLERVEAVGEIRDAVHGRDDDGELRAAHLPRRTSRCPSASPTAQAASKKRISGSAASARRRRRRRRRVSRTERHASNGGTSGAPSTPARFRPRPNCAPRARACARPW